MARGKKAAKELSPEEKLQQALVPAEEWPYPIPENWCWTTVDKVATVITGGTPSKKNPEYYGDQFPFFKPTDLDAGRHVIKASEYLSESGKNVARIIPQESTAVCCIGSVGKSGYLEIEGTTNQQINSAIPKFNPLYLFYFMNTDNFVNQLWSKSSATTISIVNKAKMESCYFPLAPLDEQQRIVDRIESLFSKLDEAKEKAQAVVDGFELRKSAILHKAFTGELTERWRKEHGVSVDNWQYRKLSNVATVISGYAFSSDNFDECNNIPCIKITNVGVGNYISENYEYLPTKFLDTYNRFKVNSGNILISLTRSYIAAGLKVCICDEPRDSLLNQRVALIKNCNIRYIYYYLRSSAVLYYVKEKSKTTNQPNLSIKDLNNLLVPIPVESEQNEIVSVLNNLLDKEEYVKSTAEAVLSQIDTMKKAILARAFRGELGTNDPAEESAEELIKAVL